MPYHYKTYKATPNANCHKRPAIMLRSNPRPCRLCGTIFEKPGTICDDCKDRAAVQRDLDRAIAAALLATREQANPKPRTEITED